MKNKTKTKKLLRFAYRRQEVVNIYKSRAIRGIGVAMLSMFAPVYLMKSGLALDWVMAFYAFQSFLSAVVNLYSAQITAFWGLSKTMLYSTLFFAVYLVIFSLSPYIGFEWLLLSAVFYGLQKGLFWPNYHYYFSQLINKKERGQTASMVEIFITLANLFGPLLGSLIIEQVNFLSLYAVAVFLLILSSYPYFLSYREVRLVSQKPSMILKDFWQGQSYGIWLAVFAMGFLLSGNLVIWPIIMYEVLEGIGSMGIFITVSAVLNIVVLKLLANVISIFSKSKLLAGGIGLWSLGWLFRFLTYNNVMLVTANIFAGTGRRLVEVLYNNALYDLSEREDISSFLIRKEFFTNLGITVACLIPLFFSTEGLRLTLALMPVISFVLLVITRRF